MPHTDTHTRFVCGHGRRKIRSYVKRATSFYRLLWIGYFHVSLNRMWGEGFLFSFTSEIDANMYGRIFSQSGANNNIAG